MIYLHIPRLPEARAFGKVGVYLAVVGGSGRPCQRLRTCPGLLCFRFGPNDAKSDPKALQKGASDGHFGDFCRNVVALHKKTKKQRKKQEVRLGSGKPHMQSVHACAVQTRFFVSAARLKTNKQNTGQCSRNHKKTIEKSRIFHSVS